VSIAVDAVSYGEQAWLVDAHNGAHKPRPPDSLSSFVGPCHDVGTMFQDLSVLGDL